MKKPLIIITSLILICIMFIGCQNVDANISASKELNKNLNLLSNTVNRLDTVDNEYLVSSDIYTLSQVKSNVPTPNHSYKNVLANSFNVIVTKENETANSDEVVVEKISLQDDLTNALKNELINRLYCDENGNCKLCDNKYTCGDNNMCNSCNQTIICDAQGNCTSCGNTLTLDNNNNCSSCNQSCVSTSPNTNMSTATKNCLNQISANNKELEVQFLSTKLDNDDNITVLKENDEEIDIEDNDINNVVTDNTLDDTTTNTIVENTNDNITTIIEDDTDSIIVDTNNSVDDNTDINNDTVSDEVIDDSEINDTNEDIINDSTVENVVPQYKVFYYTEERFAPEFLRYNPRFVNNINYESANSNLNNYVEKLQKLYTMTADVVEANNTLANYKVIILDNIDETRALNNCILEGNCTPTSNQIQALNNYIDDIKTTIRNLRECNGNLTSEINKISTANTGITHSIDVTNSNYLRILNQIDTRISYHENAAATLEQIKYLLEDATNNNSNTEEIYVEDLNNQDVITDTTVDDETTTTEDTIVNYPTEEEVVNDTIINNDEVETTDTENSISNIDTYTNSNLSNVDNSVVTNDNTDNETIVNNDNVTNANNDNVTNTTGDIVTNDNLYNNSTTDVVDNNGNTPTMVDNNTTETVPTTDTNLNNNYNNGIVNNDGYNNTIISQNNLDNNNLGNNTYRYNNDGKLYNNTNGYNNSEITNINNKNNNVNTYKYNTLIDSINRGTVNNGINTL